MIAGCTGVWIFIRAGWSSQRIREGTGEFYRIMTLLYGEIEYAATPLPQALKKNCPHAAVRTFKTVFLKTVGAGQLEKCRRKKTLREIWLAQVTVLFLPTRRHGRRRTGNFCSDFGKKYGLWR